MNKANQDIRDMIESKRLKYWEVALKIGISESRFSVWLRTPVNLEKKKKIIKAIDEL